MKEVTSILENDRFEVFVHHLSKTLTLFDKHCSCVLLNTEDTNNNRRLYQVFAELLDDRCRLDTAFAESLTKANDDFNEGDEELFNKEEDVDWAELNRSVMSDLLKQYQPHSMKE